MAQLESEQHGLTRIELERQARIKRNRQVLCDLGLDQQLIPVKPKRQPVAKQPKVKRDAEPTRKSRRLQGDVPEFEEPRQRWVGVQDENDAGQLQQPRAKRSRPAQHQGQQQQHYSDWDGHIDKAAVEALLQSEPDNPHHMHNIQRLRSMSCKALVTRVRRITNVGKLHSFIKVLQAAGGPEEVLAAAEDALADL